MKKLFEGILVMIAATLLLVLISQMDELHRLHQQAETLRDDMARCQMAMGVQP